MDSFCTMPWNGIEINTNGHLRPCCKFAESQLTEAVNGRPFNVSTHTLNEYLNSSELRSIKQKMLNGEYVHECRKCYEEEDAGVKSLRQRKNSSINVPIKKVEHINVKTLDIKLSNLCNQKCVICNPAASSMTAAETAIIRPDRMQGFIEDQYNWYKSEQIWTEIFDITSDITHLDFYGGEPWLIKKQWELVRYLVETGRSKNISLNYATNGSVFDDKWFTDYFSKFDRVSILFSADGIGDVFEYNRFPGKWKVFENNIIKTKQYQSNGIVSWIGISYTISNYSAFDIINSLKFYTKNNIEVYFNSVNENEYMINCMPEPLKQRFLNYIKDNWDNSFLTLDNVDFAYFEKLLANNTSDINWWEVFCDVTKGKDKYRNNNILDVVPEFKGYM
jgi:organic radical activating enzyme